MLIYAIIFITLALVFYTIGVWSEKLQGRLKKWHVAVFWSGLVFDTLGTILMSKIAGTEMQLGFHGITGMLAILLMIFHAGWATYVILKNNDKVKNDFHKFSMFVWLVWLVPYISGAIFGMGK